jgi:isopenicillin N synthase-like dioxygenase
MLLHGVQDIDRHPIASVNPHVEQVPVIDVAAVFEDASSNAALNAIDQIAQACKTWGVFHIVNHGIHHTQIDEVWNQTHALFALPLKEKMALLRSRQNPWGFYNRELTKNQRDKKEVFDFTRQDCDPIYHQSNRWPQRHPQFKAVMLAHQEACTAIALKLLNAFCIGLDLPADFLHPYFDGNHTGFVRLNYYPVKDPLAGLDKDQHEIADLGIHHHTDAGALTVLLQDQVSGLQVYREGFWYNVATVDGAITINTGDMLQVWSNDIYRAAIHRVLAMDSRERYSIPFFLNPAADCRVSPLPSVIAANNPSRYRPIAWGEYRGRRSDGDFADYGTEVQISQYRI